LSARMCSVVTPEMCWITSQVTSNSAAIGQPPRIAPRWRVTQ
jgi:hypothetical protein